MISDSESKCGFKEEDPLAIIKIKTEPQDLEETEEFDIPDFHNEMRLQTQESYKQYSKPANIKQEHTDIKDEIQSNPHPDAFSQSKKIKSEIQREPEKCYESKVCNMDNFEIIPVTHCADPKTFAEYFQFEFRRKTRKCYAYGCSANNVEERCFYFPRNIDRAQQWAQIIGKPCSKEMAYRIANTAVLCWKHFAEDQYTTKFKYRLNRNAVPSRHESPAILEQPAPDL